jgi:hypothetical protein
VEAEGREGERMNSNSNVLPFVLRAKPRKRLTAAQEARERIRDILLAAEASGREALAWTLAMRTGVEVDEALQALRAAHAAVADPELYRQMALASLTDAKK